MTGARSSTPIVGRHRLGRTSTGDIDAWAFDYVEAGDAPKAIETRLGRIGMLVCSELYVPELSRVLALKSADLIVYPAGGEINELLPGWRTLVWARAIENLVYTSATQNLYGDEEGVGTIGGPRGRAGVIGRRGDAPGHARPGPARVPARGG